MIQVGAPLVDLALPAGAAVPPGLEVVSGGAAGGGEGDDAATSAPGEAAAAANADATSAPEEAVAAAHPDDPATGHATLASPAVRRSPAMRCHASSAKGECGARPTAASAACKARSGL
jgi:pyruvate/2-oxoglutarate dehydrogenase complex dihydrolipoamide acyltransferase (E2) component